MASNWHHSGGEALEPEVVFTGRTVVRSEKGSVLQTPAAHGNGSSRVVRWACIWRTVLLDTEARRLLHRRFGSPPIVVPPLKPDSEMIAADATAAVAVGTDTK